MLPFVSLIKSSAARDFPLQSFYSLQKEQETYAWNLHYLEMCISENWQQWRKFDMTIYLYVFQITILGDGPFYA
jgi:hypothetical protein